jgi:hypothetical protein
MSYSENNWDHLKVSNLRFLVEGVRGSLDVSKSTLT